MRSMETNRITKDLLINKRAVSAICSKEYKRIGWANS
jgi:hypothetical protein